MKRALVVVLPFLAVFVAIAAVGVTVGDGRRERSVAPVRGPGHTPPVRTRVLVISRTMPVPSARGMMLHGRLERGSMPQTVMRGKVMTDSDCAPDFAGVSRCRNDVRLADGRTIVVRHPHDMAEVPCLTPGEDVVVRPA